MKIDNNKVYILYIIIELLRARARARARENLIFCFFFLFPLRWHGKEQEKKTCKENQLSLQVANQKITATRISCD